jgi:hypothetical protein
VTEHPIKWERHGRDGSKEVISVLGMVEPVLQAEYNVQLITVLCVYVLQTLRER